MPPARVTHVNIRHININNNMKKKKIYNAYTVMNHESEARAVTRWPDGEC